MRAALIVGLTTLVTACNGTWGVRSSFRSYVAGPAGGQISTHESVTWNDASGPGKGPFTWPIEWGTYDAVSETGTIQFSGGITAQAHSSGSDYVLDVSIWNPRLEIDGDSGTLIADLAYRPFSGTNPGTLPSLEAALDVEFATVDLSNANVDADGIYSVNNAPMVGIDEAMELIGFDDFYGTNVALDPLSAAVNPSIHTKTLAATPRTVVSRTSNLRAGDKIIVWGYGFDPTAHVGTRPPLAGQHSGVYAVFGKFAANWKPSASAPSSARTVVSQRWALPASSRAVLDPTNTLADYVTIDATGRFEAVLTVGTSSSANANYGVYTYAGSGATNSAQETETLVTLAP